MESLKRGLQSVYERLEINTDNEDAEKENPATSNNTANEALITESNLVYYLGLIEQKANSILSKYTSVREHLMAAPTTSAMGISGSTGGVPSSNTQQEVPAAKSIVAVLGSGPKVPMGQDLVHVNPPKLDDYQSDEDENEEDGAEMRPLTREELKTRTLNRLQRRGGQQSALMKKK